MRTDQHAVFYLLLLLTLLLSLWFLAVVFFLLFLASSAHESSRRWGNISLPLQCVDDDPLCIAVASVTQAVSVARSDIIKANGAAALNARAAKTKASVSLDALDVARLELRDAIQKALPGTEEHNGGSNEGTPPNRKSVPNSRGGEQVKSKAVHTTNKTSATTTATAKTTDGSGCGGGNGDEDARRRCVLGEEKLGLADKDMDSANNYASARRHFEVAAKGGDARGQLRYGQCLAQGLGGVKDEAEARLWMTRSAVQGDEEAECEVAAYTERTKGVLAAVSAPQILLRILLRMLEITSFPLPIFFPTSVSFCLSFSVSPRHSLITHSLTHSLMHTHTLSRSPSSPYTTLPRALVSSR